MDPFDFTDSPVEPTWWMPFAPQDPRVAGWPLVSSPWPTVAISVGYLFTVRMGQAWMRDREAYDLTRVMQLYNICVIVLNAYIGYEMVVTAYKEELTLMCDEVNYAPTPNAIRMAAACWWYYISKMLEFVDTLLMVLRKKDGQVTFLHLYHHSTMFPLWWIGVSYVAGGNSVIGATTNSVVHVIMYSYYFLASFGKDFAARWLWWKRYLTRLQLAQFAFVIVHAVYSLQVALRGECKFPIWMGYAFIGYVSSMVVLFSMFYFATYSRKSTKPTAGDSRVGAGVRRKAGERKKST